MYVNGTPVGKYLVSYTEFNSSLVRFRVKQPFKVAMLQHVGTVCPFECLRRVTRSSSGAQPGSGQRDAGAWHGRQRHLYFEQSDTQLGHGPAAEHDL
jgi:hypothetical protein